MYSHRKGNTDDISPAKNIIKFGNSLAAIKLGKT